ncbi:MAG: PAS domain-containing protein [Bacillota bacterium]
MQREKDKYNESQSTENFSSTMVVGAEKYHQLELYPGMDEFKHQVAEDNPLKPLDSFAEHKKMEQALRESETKYRMLFNTINEGLSICEILCNEEGEPVDFRVLFLNPAAENIIGMKKEFIIGNTASKLLPHISRSMIKTFGKVALTGESTRVKLFDSKTSNYYDMLCFSPSPGQFAVLSVDVTQDRLNENFLRKHGEELESVVAERTLALEQSHNQMESILESITDAFYVLDDQWRFTFVNKEAERLLGIPREKLLGYDFRNLSSDPIQKLFCAYFTKAMSQKSPVQFELKGLRSEVWFEGRVYPTKEGITVYLKDITERKKAEETLKQSEDKFSIIFYSSPNPMSIIDMHSTRYIDVNESFVKFTGYNRDEIINKSLEELLLWADPDRKDIIQKLLINRSISGVELAIRKKDQTIGYVLSAAEIVTLNGRECVLGTFQDMTNRKATEKKLRISEERFSKMFHHNPVSMSIKRVKDDTYVDVNESWQKSMGFSREETIGRTPTDLNIWQQPDENKKLLHLLLREGKLNSIEQVFRVKSGELRTFLVSLDVTLVNDELCRLASMIDVTERKKLERDMAHLEQLNVIGQMAASIGHEVRNPMTTIRGFLQLLSAKKDLMEYKDYLGLMIEELDRANSIISEFLSLASNKLLDLKMTSLNTIVTSLYPLIAASATVSDKSVRLELDDVPNLLLDAKEIRQLLLNLAKNGLEAMQEGKTLTI